MKNPPLIRVLCVSPFFPPSADSESFCGGKIVMALAARGVDVTVLCKDSFDLFGRDDSPRWDPLLSHSVLIPQLPRQGRLRTLAFALKYRLAAFSRWVHPTVERALQLHADRPFDLIYSRSLPFYAHVAGFFISRKLKLPWIANVNDPWDLHHFPGQQARATSRLSSLTSDYWLRKTLACADAVTFPSRRLALYTARLPGCRARLEVIPHISAKVDVSEPEPGFTLVHAGKLGGKEITGRSPLALLQGIKRFLHNEPDAVGKIRLVLVGAASPETEDVVTKLGLEGVLVQTGRVSYDESLRLIARASACVLIEGEMEEGLYLPSKLVDYIAARKPVLAFSPRVGTLEDLSTDRAIMPLNQGDEYGIAYAIGLLFRTFSAGQLESLAPSDTLVFNFSPEVVASRFLNLAAQLSPKLRESLQSEGRLAA